MSVARSLACLLALALGASVLSACGSSDDESVAAGSSGLSAEEVEVVERTEPLFARYCEMARDGSIELLDALIINEPASRLAIVALDKPGETTPAGETVRAYAERQAQLLSDCSTGELVSLGEATAATLRAGIAGSEEVREGPWVGRRDAPEPQPVPDPSALEAR